uniref:carboxyl transferase domain-containing protein n=1 Tax=Oscillibacter sp. TaxID=1945593 RepID=UPI002D806909
LRMQAAHVRRPVLTFIATAGAYPGLEAEARGQGEAIARNLLEMSRLTVPVIAVVTGEGNSGGALALAVADRVLMLENAVYAILSPEGFASILWRDAGRHGEACELMKLTAPDLLALGVVDGVVPEPEGGAHLAPEVVFRELDRALSRHLAALLKESGSGLVSGRYQKFRKMGLPPKEEA